MTLKVQICDRLVELCRLTSKSSKSVTRNIFPNCFCATLLTIKKKRFLGFSISSLARHSVIFGKPRRLHQKTVWPLSHIRQEWKSLKLQNSRFQDFWEAELIFRSCSQIWLIIQHLMELSKLCRMRQTESQLLQSLPRNKFGNSRREPMVQIYRSLNFYVNTYIDIRGCAPLKFNISTPRVNLGPSCHFADENPGKTF